MSTQDEDFGKCSFRNLTITLRKMFEISLKQINNTPLIMMADILRDFFKVRQKDQDKILKGKTPKIII